MHSREAAAAEQHASVSLGWRVVDALISARRSRLATPLAKLKPLLLLAPGLALATILAIGLVRLAWSSLHSYDSFLGTQGHFSFTQYSQVVSDPQFKTVLVRTLTMAVVTSLIAVTFAVPFSLVMARASRRFVRLALMVIVFIPYLTGDITRTFGWLAALGPNGPVAWVCQQLGLQPPTLIGTLWAVGLGSVQVLLPAAVVILLPGVLRLDPELEQAARTLGARPHQVFLRVVLPQLRVACFSALTVCWAFAMGDFADPGILGQGVKDYLANLLQDRYLAIGNQPLGSAVGMFLLFAVLAGAAVILTLSRVRWQGRRL